MSTVDENISYAVNTVVVCEKTASLSMSCLLVFNLYSKSDAVSFLFHWYFPSEQQHIQICHCLSVAVHHSPHICALCLANATFIVYWLKVAVAFYQWSQDLPNITIIPLSRHLIYYVHCSVSQSLIKCEITGIVCAHCSSYLKKDI